MNTVAIAITSCKPGSYGNFRPQYKAHNEKRGWLILRATLLSHLKKIPALFRNHNFTDQCTLTVSDHDMINSRRYRPQIDHLFKVSVDHEFWKLKDF